MFKSYQRCPAIWKELNFAVLRSPGMDLDPADLPPAEDPELYRHGLLRKILNRQRACGGTGTYFDINGSHAKGARHERT